MSDAPVCMGDGHHIFKLYRGRFRKGSLCLCGAAVLDKTVYPTHGSSWLASVYAWDALL